MRKLLILCFLFCALSLRAQLVNTFIPFGGTNVQTASYAIQASDVGKLVVMNCSSCTATLPSTIPQGYNSQWAVWIVNINSSALTVSPNGLQLNGSSSSISLGTNSSVYVTTSASAYYGAQSTLGSSTTAAATGPYFIGPGVSTMALPSTGSSGLVAGTANAIRIYRFVLPIATPIGRATFQAQSNSNGHCSFGIYSADGSTKLVDTGVFNNTAFSNPSVFTRTLTQVVLPAGTYWFAQTDDSNSGGWAATSFNNGATASGLIRGSSNGSRGIYGKSSTSSTAGVLPSSIAVTSLTDDSDGTIAAVLWESQ